MITVLSPQGDVRGTYENKVPNATPYFEDKLLDNLETEQTTLEFAVPLQSPDSEWLEGFSTVLYPDKDGVLRELTVINVWEDWNREEPLKRVVCEDSSVDILLKTHVVPFTAGSLEEAIRGALMASPWEYVIGEDTANIGYYLVDVKEYTDVRSVLETIKQTYGIEYRFSARFDGRKLTRVLNVAKQFGADTGKYFIYDRDLVNIERTIDYDNIHTSVITYWQEDDVMRTLAGYNPVNKIAGFRKDLSSDQIYHNEAHSQYDSDDYGKVLIMKSSSTDPELSYLEACNKLLDYIAPTYTYNVNVHILETALGFEGTEQIHLGDTVWLKEKVGDMELGLSARVIQLITSHTNPEEDEVTFTNFKEIDVADSAEVNALREMIQQIQEQQDNITQTVVQVTENITQLQQGQEGIITSLDGKSSISVGATPNPNPKNGDTWFTDVLDPETGKTYSTTKVWVEATQQWETKYSAKDAEEALEAANEAAQAGADAKAAADAAKVAADDATAAGNAASQKADQAVTDAAAAKAEADAIKVDVGKLQTDVGKAQTDASKALTDSATAITKVGQVESNLTTVTTDVNGIKTTISGIETAQGETTQKLTEVETNVNGLTVTVGQVKTTADGAMSKATTLETTVDGLKVTVGQVETTANGAMQKATQVEATAEGLKTTVTAVETTVNNLEVGARNYLQNSESPKFRSYLTSTVAIEENVSVPEWKATNAVRHTISGGTGGTVAATLQAGRLVTAGVKYIHSIYIKNEGTTTIRLNNNLSQAVDVSAGETKRVVFKPSGNAAGTAAMQFVLYRLNAADVQKFVVWHAMIAEGTIVNDWVPSPDDMATQTQVTQIEATVDGLTTTVGQVKTTADSALSKATSVEQTANGLTNTVATIQTDIVDLTNRFPDYNFQKKTPAPVLEGANLTAAYDAGGLVLQNSATSGSQRAYWSLSGLALGKTYNIKIYANVGQSTVRRDLEVGFSGGENVKFSFPDTTPAWVSGTAKASGNGAALSLWIPNGGSLRLRELYIYEANTNITSSQITQLSDNINLKVDKNGVIAQINVSSEGVLIDGKNVWITGLTKIDNAVIKTAAIADLAVTTAKIANLAVGTAQIGSAAITEAKIGNLAVTTAKIADLAVTNAKIGSLSANKITTGTLDAGVISVINLNASNITSGTLSGLRIESPYDVPVASGATSNRRGSLVITDGYLRNVWQNYVRSSGSVTANGELTLNHEALTAVDRTGSSTTSYNTSMALHAGGLTLQNYAGTGGTLSYQDLFSLGATSIPANSGFEQYNTSPSSGNHPTAVRNGRLVQLKGSYRNINLIATGAENQVMGTLPWGFRPLYSINFIVQGTGANIYLLTIEPDGQLKLGRYRGDTGSSNNYKYDYKDVAAGSWLNIACVFAAADV